MAERVQDTRDRADPAAALPAEEPEGGGRHCWVLDAADGCGLKRAGLLLEWRRAADGGWEGRVVYLAQLRTVGMAAVEEWMPAVRLLPA